MTTMYVYVCVCVVVVVGSVNGWMDQAEKIRLEKYTR